MAESSESKIPLTRYAWLSIGAAVVTITMKSAAYALTGSVGLLSDAFESTVNLAAAVVALLVLRMVARPASDEFTFGFSKAEYFASGFEGGMILLAAAGIVITAVPRLINPVPLEQLGIGLLISVVAALINLGVALVLMRAGKRYNSAPGREVSRAAFPAGRCTPIPGGSSIGSRRLDNFPRASPCGGDRDQSAHRTRKIHLTGTQAHDTIFLRRLRSYHVCFDVVFGNSVIRCSAFARGCRF